MDSPGFGSILRARSQQLMWEPIREVYQSRELLFALAYRDIRIRYKQTVIGAGWAIVMPLLMMIVFTQAFQKTDRLELGDIPYSVYVLCALLPWQFSAAACFLQLPIAPSQFPIQPGLFERERRRTHRRPDKYRPGSDGFDRRRTARGSSVWQENAARLDRRARRSRPTLSPAIDTRW